MPRPNIVFFMLDQLSAKWLEAASAGTCPTSNIDRFRRNAVSFSQAIVSNPLCCPSRATLATGLTTRQHGVLQNGYELDPSIPTFMQALQANGWRTGAFGKVHLKPHFAGVHPDYHPYGFDVTHITEDARGGEWLDWVRSEHPDHFEAALATIWPSHIPDFQSYGPRKEDLSKRIREIRETFRWATPEFPQNTPGYYTLPFPEEVSQTAWITRHALDFITGTEPRKPLFAHISYVQPHGPFCPPGEYMRYVDEGKIPTPAPIEWTDDPHAPKCFAKTEGAHTAIPEEWRTRRHYYFADLVHLDHQLGLVMDALERSGRVDNTYLVLLADHGELLFDHGFSGKGERHYDACLRVPLMVSGPGLEQGTVRDEIVQLEDLFPTVLEMAGLPPPQPRTMGPYLKETPEVLPGKSLLGLCRGERPQMWRDAAYSESYNNITSASTVNWARTVRTSEWRYTMYPLSRGEQLFRLSEDPDEQRNLAGDATHAAVRREMRDRLLDLVILQDYPSTVRSLFALGVH